MWLTSSYQLFRIKVVRIRVLFSLVGRIGSYLRVVLRLASSNISINPFPISSETIPLSLPLASCGLPQPMLNVMLSL